MSEQPPKQNEVVTVQLKKSGKNNKTVLIAIGVIVGLLVLGALAVVAIGWFAYDKAGDSIKDAINQAETQLNERILSYRR